jgi:hypothetical protein
VVDCCLEDLPVCSGNGGDEHLFLRAEGHCFCSVCNKVTCLQCTFQREEGEPYYCYDCFIPAISVQHDELDNHLSIAELREELRLLGIETNASDDMCILMNLYEEAKCDEFYSKVWLENIKTPIEAPEYLQVLNRNKISSFDFKNGGSFIADSRLNTNIVFTLIRILASLVTIFQKKEGEEKNGQIVLTGLYHKSLSTLPK